VSPPPDTRIMIQRVIPYNPRKIHVLKTAQILAQRLGSQVGVSNAVSRADVLRSHPFFVEKQREAIRAVLPSY